MTEKGFVNPEPLLGEMSGERMSDVEAQYPEPRSSADEERIETERQRLMRELEVLRRTGMWAVPPNEP